MKNNQRPGRKNKIILGLVGEIASGKGTVVKYLVNKYQASSYRFSTPIRDVCQRLKIETNRKNLQTMSAILRQTFGEDLFSKVMKEEAKNDNNNVVVIDGIRRPTDIIRLKELPEFKIIYVTANIKTRYQRLIKRAENSRDVLKTYSEFTQDHEAETEVAIPKIGEQADYKIDNNGTKSDLYKQIDTILNKL